MCRMQTMSTDQSLMAQLQEGDLDALGILYERHKKLIYQTILRITRDNLATEDIIQDCFIRLHRYADRFDTSRPFKPWLYRMAINLANSYLVHDKRWESPAEGFFEWIPCPDEYCPEWQAEKNDIQDRMMEAVSELNIQQSKVVVLYYLRSHSLKEVARLLDCPVGTVKSRLFYGRENMFRMLASDRKAIMEAGYV